MNAGQSMSHPKRRSAGREERIRQLCAHFPDLVTALTGVKRFHEDALDAYAMLWTAKRFVNRASRTLPMAPDVDRRGLRMEIVA
jgi:predicted RNase H-like nuclease